MNEPIGGVPDSRDHVPQTDGSGTEHTPAGEFFTIISIFFLRPE